MSKCKIDDQAHLELIDRRPGMTSQAVYGDGRNIRDWLFVTDHCEAIRQVLLKGARGETHNIGGQNEKTNIEVVAEICTILSDYVPDLATNGSLNSSKISSTEMASRFPSRKSSEYRSRDMRCTGTYFYSE